jgi:hypothetical protein
MTGKVAFMVVIVASGVAVLAGCAAVILNWTLHKKDANPAATEKTAARPLRTRLTHIFNRR